MTEETFRDILRKYWGYDNFRGIQSEIINSISQGKDTLGLMPTGGGKSVTFQVPAIAMEGVCIVITPLIALMKDQVENLRKRGIKAAAIYSGMTNDQIISTLENCIFGAYKLLYVSPERLSSTFFLKKINHAHISFITVDEAHCITQWGYDFRPSYLKIKDFRKIFPDTAILALTATATPAVVEDIQRQLDFKCDNVFRMSFLRTNLAYIVEKPINRLEKTTQLIENAKGSCIVYVQTRDDAKNLAEYLNENGQSATFYHAHLDSTVKNDRQERWKKGEVKTMVATNAFGMGIDKPDVRMVVHYECPSSIEAYFQEAGRAGRDGEMAKAVLLYDYNDHKRILQTIADSFPEKDYIRKVYDDLAYFFQVALGDGFNCNFEFNTERFCRTFKHFPTKALAAIKILVQSGYLDFSDSDDNKSRVRFLLQRDELYRLRNNSHEEDMVIETLLRFYGGLFVDYTFIDESSLAQRLGLDSERIYVILKSLNEKNILHYIPRKKIPHIRYKQRREDSQRLVIPKAVYEDMHDRAMERAMSIINYAENNNLCRSRLLLNYFGEKTKHNCGMCDFCTNRNNETAADDKNAVREALIRKILDFLADGKRHQVYELMNLSDDTTALADTITFMTHERMFGFKDGEVFL